MNNERDKKMSRATLLALDIISLDEQIIAQLGRSGFTEFALRARTMPSSWPSVNIGLWHGLSQTGRYRFTLILKLVTMIRFCHGPSHHFHFAS